MKDSDQAGVRPHLSVTTHRDIDRDRAVIARPIVERQRLVTDCPFTRGKISNDEHRASRKQDHFVQPKRPAMKRFMRGLLDVLKISDVVPNSISSPRNMKPEKSETLAACCKLCVTMTIA